MKKTKKIKLRKFRNKKITILLSFLLISLSTFVFLQFTKSENIDSLVTEFDKPLELGSELTYYLDVTYDGVDREGVEASKTTLSKIYSDYIYVEDKLPDGLTFKKFEVSSFMTGARPQGNVEKSCDGYIYDDSGDSTDPKNYKGLHYDENTRTVSFRIKRLQAGCHLTIGIVTVVPDTVDDPATTNVVEKRRDFWNSATALEGSQFVTSNLVHAWIESEETTLYEVSYRYDDTAPSNVPIYPIQKYAGDTIVNFMTEPKIEGYIFKGWTIVEGLGAVNNNNGTFTMPNTNVVIQGSFEKLNSNPVIYEIEGTSPTGYIVPDAKNYYQNATVSIDSMKAGDTFNGYKFLGWENTDVEVDEYGSFIMPNNPVTFKGKFEIIKYKVEYKYSGSNIPDNIEPPLPEEHAPGESVTLPRVSDVGGYEFLSWDKENGFIMPESDVIVYGEWRVKTGVFAPTITKEIIDKKDYYIPGDIVNYRIVVTNPADYSIKEIQVREKNKKSKFIYSFSNKDYTKMSDHIVKINTIPANGSVEVYASYFVTQEDKGTIKNEVEILGALADNGNSLDTSKEYKAEASFKVMSKLDICKVVNNKNAIEKDFQIYITNEVNSYETWINLRNNECKSVYVSPGNYSLKEVIPQEFELNSVTLKKGNEDSQNYNPGQIFKVEEFQSYNFTFINDYKKKGFLHSFGRVVNSIKSKSQDTDSIIG